jgi:hypothetical protein
VELERQWKWKLGRNLEHEQGQELELEQELEHEWVRCNMKDKMLLVVSLSLLLNIILAVCLAWDLVIFFKLWGIK